MSTPQHLIDITSQDTEFLRRVLATAAAMREDPARYREARAGRLAINLFYEPSTRTRVSFEIAALNLGMRVVNVAASDSSVKKGETLMDTFRTLEAMGPDVIVLRHPDDEALVPLAAAAGPKTHLVNAGSGSRAHPTQALLDAFTLQRHLPKLEDATVLVAGALGIFAYVTGHVNFAKYLGFPYIGGVGEIVVFCGAMVGAGLGFLWFNTYPAQVFMGDVGALALGAALGVLAVIVRQELVLFIMGGIFVAETLSVMLQVASFKLTGRRIFRMAPLHHHYELKGWPEPRIIVRFWIITVVLVLIGLASLKIR